MKTKAEKKEEIRQQILSAAQVYRDHLAGKVFLYVYGSSYFEVVFRTDHFMHLTGVNSSLGASDFYKKAKKSVLTTNQFYFDNEYSYGKAKKKLPCLIRLPELTNSLVCVVKEMKTVTLTYQIGVTNLEFTLALTKPTDCNGNDMDGPFLPRSLRVKDKAIENSSDSEFIDFIFCKDASSAKYFNVLFSASEKKPPYEIKNLLDKALMESLYGD